MDSVSETDKGQQDQVKAADVEIELASMKAANHLHHRIEQLQQGLLMYKLQCTQSCERVVFQMPIKRLIVHTYRLVNATVKLIFNTYTTEYRLVIVDSCKSVCVSMELPYQFFHQLATSDDTNLFFNYPCWIAESGQCQTTVYEHRTGITLTCASDENQQTLLTMFRSVAQGDQTMTVLNGKGPAGSTPSTAEQQQNAGSSRTSLR